MADTRRQLARARAAWSWFTERSTRLVRIAIAVSLGAAFSLWQLSPWAGNSAIGLVLFWVASIAILVLVAEWPIKLWLRRRGELRTLNGATLLKGGYIERVVELGRGVMGDGHADEATVRARLERCPLGIHVIVRRPDRSRVWEEVVGYLACWTISESASDRFLDGTYTSALDLQQSDFVVDRPGATYVSMLYGADPKAKRAVLQLAADRIRELVVPVDGPTRLLARPATHDGELLMRKVGMRALPIPGSVVWSIDRETLLTVLDTSRT